MRRSSSYRRLPADARERLVRALSAVLEERILEVERLRRLREGRE